ncbi:hypothetical protein [Acidiphilium acidophilum]|uniref:Uncharacterized protein n=1 Tax=Acidiphilium acidophilum TaxID=76588 RepID=A0AAW9DTD3_ACIAO|nr:hypothetical protein [Acidiphilium acidophilum]MDX5931302.1 hypothetical protein [Acidiphilium acidophilum]
MLASAIRHCLPGDLEHFIEQDAAFWPLRTISYGFSDDIDRLVIDTGVPVRVVIPILDRSALVWARLAAEWLALVSHGVPAPLAGLAAARIAIQFASSESIALSGSWRWMIALQGDAPPAPAEIVAVWHTLRHSWANPVPDLAQHDCQTLINLWPLIGTAETIMETGGDVRLLRDPQSNLNGYGCSHRPRPWAITYASSTASSISERGYEAADRIRLRATAEMLISRNRHALSNEANQIRRSIARSLRLPAGSAVVLAASGTDCELLALAIAHLSTADCPLTTILLAPEETGSGVPMAAVGKHFAIDTANGHDVIKEAPIAGFRDDTALVSIPLRDEKAEVRPRLDIQADILEAIESALHRGRKVILHVLDLSKTGLLAPTMSFLRDICGRYAGHIEIIVDACQMRMAPERLQAYLALGAIVQITGSKFLTGPPFAGAALLPPAIAKRLSTGRLPAGLNAYSSRGDWPASAFAAQNLPSGANYGLILRWSAALAELRAFAKVSNRRKALTIARFKATIEGIIQGHRIFILQPSPVLERESEGWDTARTVFSFAVRRKPDSNECLDPSEMRRLYHWLNADCSEAFEDPSERTLAARICHIGQPVSLPNSYGGKTGWLRVSAGARLFSGEPSHHHLRFERRMDRELSDLRIIFDKIILLRNKWSSLSALDPRPSYR